MKRLLTLLAIAAVLFACSAPDSKTKDTPITNEPVKAPVDTVKVQPKPTLVLNHTFNDVARVLAGQTVDSSSKYYEVTQTERFEKYSVEHEEHFKKYMESKIKNLRTWADVQLTQDRSACDTVLYPFSGPDFTYLFNMYPTAHTYYMFGLEPVGIVPEIPNSRHQLSTMLKILHGSISDNLNLSFFKTIDMSYDLRRSEIRGTTPILMFFMAKAGVHIQNIRYVHVNPSGKLEEREAEARVGHDYAEAVEISFLRPGEDKISTLVYMSTDISNQGMNHNSSVSQLISGMHDFNVIIKSASYLLHRSDFSTIRNLILDRAHTIVQDDSGIPYSFLSNESKWKVDCFGKYSRPISLFSSRMQSDYRKVFAERAQDIDFRYGYNSPSNIVIARRNSEN